MRTRKRRAACWSNGAASSMSPKSAIRRSMSLPGTAITPRSNTTQDLSPVGAILFDHPDPSIFTVLTAPTEEAGTANIDFVIFPPRWLVAEHSFRPPWYHPQHHERVHGLDGGQYDAKGGGFRARRHEPAQHDAAAWARYAMGFKKGFPNASLPSSSTTPWPLCSRRAFPSQVHL